MAESFVLTPEEQKVIVECAQQVWNDIGADILESKRWESRKCKVPTSIPQPEVVEVVMDAGRLAEEVRCTRGARTPAVLALIEAWDRGVGPRRKAAQAVVRRLVRRAFPDRVYGL